MRRRFLKYVEQLKHYDDNHDNPDNVENVFVHVFSPSAQYTTSRLKGDLCEVPAGASLSPSVPGLEHPPLTMPLAFALAFGLEKIP